MIENIFVYISKANWNFLGFSLKDILYRYDSKTVEKLLGIKNME
jgi:hypothetical protein